MNDREKFEKWAAAVQFHSGHSVNTVEAFAAWSHLKTEIDALIHDNDNMRKAIVEYDKENAALKAENERLRDAAEEIIKIWEGKGRTDMYGRVMDNLRAALEGN